MDFWNLKIMLRRKYKRVEIILKQIKFRKLFEKRDLEKVIFEIKEGM